MSKESIETLLNLSSVSEDLKIIANKVLDGIRISKEDAQILFEKGDLGFLGSLANFVKESKHGHHVFFNRN